MKKLENTEGVALVAVGEIKTHPALQPRDLGLLKARERVRQEQQSERHAHDMALLLKADKGAELAPVALADVGGVLYVVDGHHRLRAYRGAKRERIPAKVERMTLQQASQASKLANVSHTKLEMQPAQKRNALWHHLNAITQGGNCGLPEGTSQRALAGRFGCALSTAQSMLKRLPEVDSTKYPAEHCDGITGFPHWRFVCETARSGMYQAMTAEARVQWQADKYRQKLAKLWEQFDPQAVQVAHAQLRAEALEGSEMERLGELEGAFWGASEPGPLDF